MVKEIKGELSGAPTVFATASFNSTKIEIL